MNAPYDHQEAIELRAELVECQWQLQTLKSSFRYQLGDAIVSSFLAGGRGRFVPLISAIRRGRALMTSSAIRKDLFSGLPTQYFQWDGDTPSNSELKRLKAYIRRLARDPSNLSPMPEFSSRWTSLAAELGREYASAIVDGYPLPPKSVDIFDGADTKRTLPARVLYVSRHQASMIRNGYARRTREIVRQLATLGLQLSVGVTSMAVGRYGRFEGIEEIGLAPIEGGVGLRSYVEALARNIEDVALRNKSEIIHAASNYLVGLASIVAARRIRIPCLYEIRGLWELTRLEFDRGFSSSLGFQFQSAMERFCADEASALVVGSEGIADELYRRGMKRRHFHLAPSGGAVLTDVPQGAVDRWRSVIPRDSKVLGYAGSITRYEGFATLAAALAKLVAQDQAYYLLILGDGEFRRSAEKLFFDAGLGERTLFAGRTSPNEVAAAYRVMDLAVYPRDSAPVTRVVEPLKPVEALASGVPVLVTDLPPLIGLRHQCPGVYGFPPGDSLELANRVIEFFRMPLEDRYEVGQQAKKWVEQNRSWRKTATTILQAYTESFKNDRI